MDAHGLSPWHGTTILSVRRGNDVVVSGDGQVTMGQSIILKSNANMVRRLAEGRVIVGFADATADATTLFERLEGKLEQYPALFQTALELGACIAGACHEHRVPLGAYAYNIGIAFQIVDDLLDYTSDVSTLGKTVGNDFFEGQMTPRLIYLREAMDTYGENKTQFQNLFEKELRSEEDLLWVQRKLEQYNIKEKVQEKSQSFAKKAYLAILPLPEHPVKDTLLDLTDFVVERCN